MEVLNKTWKYWWLRCGGKWDKVSLQISLKWNLSNSSYILLLDVNFENLIVVLHVLYVLNIHIKFHSNQILFTIQSIKLFKCIILDKKNLKFKHLIDDIVMDLLSSWNFSSTKDIIRIWNLTVRFLKFTFNEKNIRSVWRISLQTKFGEKHFLGRCGRMIKLKVN